MLEPVFNYFEEALIFYQYKEGGPSTAVLFSYFYFLQV